MGTCCNEECKAHVAANKSSTCCNMGCKASVTANKEGISCRSKSSTGCNKEGKAPVAAKKSSTCCSKECKAADFHRSRGWGRQNEGWMDSSIESSTRLSDEKLRRSRWRCRRRNPTLLSTMMMKIQIEAALKRGKWKEGKMLIWNCVENLMYKKANQYLLMTNGSL